VYRPSQNAYISIKANYFSTKEYIMGFLPGFLSTRKQPIKDPARIKELSISKQLVESAQADVNNVLQQLGTGKDGLSESEARERLKQYGPNEVAKEKRKSVLIRLLSNFKNPLVILLLVLGSISYLTGDMRATTMIFIMVLLGVVLRFFQELRSDIAAEKLKAMVSTSTTVLRDDKKKEIFLKELVPGDVVLMSAGDMVPADVRLLSAKDLHVNQATLTGESLPVEKSGAQATDPFQNPLEMSSICFL
jgi:Mg2+-importing ATPase